MEVGIYENVPILREMLEARRRDLPFGEKLSFQRAVSGKRYDLILSDLPYYPSARPFTAPLLLFPDHARIPQLPDKSQLLLGGMSPWDDVGFSSIGETDAMLCLQREVFLSKRSILPFEKKVPFDRTFSLYKNLAAALAFALAELTLAEES